MIAQQIAGKATRDALFLTSYAATELPKAMIASAAISVAGVLIMSRLLVRYGPARLVPVAFTLSGALFIVEWLLQPADPGPIAWLVYLHMAAFGSIVISGFWSVVNERFDPHTAKRKIGRIGTGATFGGVIGGLGAERIAAYLDVRSVLMVLAVLNVMCAVGVFRVGAPKSVSKKKSEQKSSGASGLQLLRETPYLRNLAGLVALVAITSSLVDYAFKAAADSQLQSSEELIQFFAVFYTVTSILTFVLQTAFAKRALARLGIGGVIAILPASVLGLGALGIVVTRIQTLVVLRATEFIVANSLFRSGYELLYTPLAQDRKRATKTIIDVGGERMGDALGSALILMVLFLVPALAEQVVLGLAVAGAVATLLVARHLHRGYVGALAESLRNGSLSLSDSDVVDATTRRTLSETTMALDRERLLKEIRLLRESQPDDGGVKQPVSKTPSGRPAPRSLPPGPVDARLRADVEALMSGDEKRIRAALERDGPLSIRLVTFAIPLLARRDLYKRVVKSLSTVAPKVTGQLVDALLDPERPFVIRRRVPRVLAEVSSRRASDGLFAGLKDERFEVRYQCGQALASIRERDPDAVEFSRETVYAAARRELEVGKKVWESQRLLDEDPQDRSPWLDDVIRSRLHRSLEHVFTILSIGLDREALTLSLKALGSDDRSLRGTALEYLENVLPDDIRKRLWPFISAGDRGRRESRPRQEIVEDLLKSMDSMTIDRDSLIGGD